MTKLKDMGIELMVSSWPFVGINVSKNWARFSNENFLVKNDKGSFESFWGPYNTPTGNALIDATNEKAMEETMKRWHEGYGQYGIRAGKIRLIE